MVPYSFTSYNTEENPMVPWCGNFSPDTVKLVTIFQKNQMPVDFKVIFKNFESLVKTTSTYSMSFYPDFQEFDSVSGPIQEH